MIIDTNVSLSRWPFRRLRGDDPDDLVSVLQSRNVRQAWAGSFDGMLHKDIAGVNSRLAADCRSHGKGLLIPFGSINPKFPDWQEDVRRCKEDHRMPGIRLHPNYHGYALTDPVFTELLGLAASRGLIVQLALRMEDERTQHPLMRVSPVDPAPLTDIIKGVPRLRLVILNCSPGAEPEQMRRLSEAGAVYFDFSMLEGLGGVSRMIRAVTLNRVVFGSNFPFFYFEAALLKVQESGLTEAEKTAIFEENASGLLGAP